MPHSARRRAKVEKSAGGVIYRHSAAGPHILLIHDAYGHWGLPKGHIEAGETPVQAALREVREETGLYELVAGPLLRTVDWYFRTPKGLIHKYCHFFLIESPRGETVPQAEEGITECRWLAVREAVERISYENAREVLKLAELELRSGAEPAA